MSNRTRSHLDEWAALLGEDVPEDAETPLDRRSERSTFEFEPAERHGK
jgi:hypothetical protein